MYTFNHIRIFCNCRRNVEELFLFRKELKFVHIYFDIASSLSQIVMICLIMSVRSAVIVSISSVSVSIVINTISVSNYCKYCSVICICN